MKKMVSFKKVMAFVLAFVMLVSGANFFALGLPAQGDSGLLAAEMPAYGYGADIEDDVAESDYLGGSDVELPSDTTGPDIAPPPYFPIIRII